MITEPYICIQGSKEKETGTIEWFRDNDLCPCGCKDLKADSITGIMPEQKWVPYADFEREKLEELQNVKAAYKGFNGITLSCMDGYWLLLSRKDCTDKRCEFPWQTLSGDLRGKKQHCHHYGSAKIIGYEPTDYDSDSESNRLLKRAEFLKAVCEKESIPWPEEKGECEHAWKEGSPYCVHCGKKANQGGLFGEKKGKPWEESECKLCQDHPSAGQPCIECQGKPQKPSEEEKKWRNALMDLFLTSGVRWDDGAKDALYKFL